MKRLFMLLLLVLIPAGVWAQSDMVTGKATPQEVYQKVSEAARFLSEAGEKGLKELRAPRGNLSGRTPTCG